MKHFILLNTPLGKMVAIGCERVIYSLQFKDDPNDPTLIEGYTKPLSLIEVQVNQYFGKSLKTFTVPIELKGTPFQILVWKMVQNIEYGKTFSYSSLALKLNNPKAARAVGSCCKANKFNLIIPCHRVISLSNTLRGYNGGAFRKQALIELEK